MMIFFKKFVCVFPSDYVNRFIQFHVLMKQKQSPYPFVVMSTERVSEKGEHWWSYLGLDPPKQLFLFNSFRFTDFKDFTIQDDPKIINKILYGINDFNKRGNVINSILLKFLVATYENLKQKEKNKFSKST